MFLSNQRRLKSFTNECSYFYFHAFTKGHLRLYLSFFTCSANWWKSVPNIWHHLLLRWNCTIGLLHTFVYHLCIWRHLLAKPFLVYFFANSCQERYALRLIDLYQTWRNVTRQVDKNKNTHFWKYFTTLCNQCTVLRFDKF